MVTIIKLRRSVGKVMVTIPILAAKPMAAKPNVYVQQVLSSLSSKASIFNIWEKISSRHLKKAMACK